jgi:hypothetical protein
MKLLPTKEKVQIKWFWVANDGTKIRNNQGFIHYAWDATCSCGWATNTGGAIKASVQRDVEKHKWLDHDYEWDFTTKRREAK